MPVHPAEWDNPSDNMGAPVLRPLRRPVRTDTIRWKLGLRKATDKPMDGGMACQELGREIKAPRRTVAHPAGQEPKQPKKALSVF